MAIVGEEENWVNDNLFELDTSTPGTEHSWRDTKLEKLFSTFPLDKTKLRKLVVQGIPPSVRANIYPQLLKISELDDYEADYQRALKRAHGAVIPKVPIPPTFGGRPFQHKLALTSTAWNHVNHILCIVSHDNPQLEFCPYLPPIVALLAHFIKDSQKLYACVVSLLKLNSFKSKSQDQFVQRQTETEMPGESNARRRWLYFPIHLKESKLFSRAFGNLLYKTDRKLHAHLTDLHSTSPDPFWTSWIQNVFIDVLPQPILWRFMDSLLIEGYKAFLRFGTAIIMLHKQTLFQLTNIVELTKFMTPPIFEIASPTSGKRYKSAADEICVMASGVFINYASVKRVHEHHASLAAVSKEDELAGANHNLRYQRAIPKFLNTASEFERDTSPANVTPDEDDDYSVDSSPRIPFSTNIGRFDLSAHEESDNEEQTPVELTRKESGELLPTSSIASTDAWVALWSWIPPQKRTEAIELVFTTKVHGYYLPTLCLKCKEKAPLILAIETQEGDVFGAYLSTGLPDLEENPEQCNKWVGNGETFLFSLVPSAKMYPWIGRRSETENTDAIPSYFINMSLTSLSIGAGGDKVGIELDETLMNGVTGRCTTFENDPLTHDRKPNFECSLVEVFSFTSG